MSKSSLRLMQGSVFDLLDALRDTHDDQFDYAVHHSDVADFIRARIADDDALGKEVVEDVARKLTRAWVEARKPPVPTQPGQLALWYDPDALLPLGEREVVRMNIAKGPQVERWRSVLTQNFESQSLAYFGHMSYIDDRLPRMRDGDRTLGDVEDDLVEIADE